MGRTAAAVAADTVEAASVMQNCSALAAWHRRCLGCCCSSSDGRLLSPIVDCLTLLVAVAVAAVMVPARMDRTAAAACLTGS